jgi:hypothetical protein
MRVDASVAKAVDAYCDDYQESWGANPDQGRGQGIGECR